MLPSSSTALSSSSESISRTSILVTTKGATSVKWSSTAARTRVDVINDKTAHAFGKSSDTFHEKIIVTSTFQISHWSVSFFLVNPSLHHDLLSLSLLLMLFVIYKICSRKTCCCVFFGVGGLVGWQSSKILPNKI